MGKNYKGSRKYISSKLLSRQRIVNYNLKIINKVVDDLIVELSNKNVISDKLTNKIQISHLKIALILTYGYEINDLNLSNEIIHVENEITKVRSHIQNIQDYLPFPIRNLWNLFSNYKSASNSLSLKREKYLNKFHLYTLEQFNSNKNLSLFVKNSLMFNYFKNDLNKISTAEIKSICLTMVSAGLDNVALNFKFGIYMLSKYSNFWENIYLNLIKPFNNNSKLAYDNLINDNNFSCQYLIACIKEILRLFSVLPMALPRETTGPINYKNCLIPKGTTLFMNCWSGNHDFKKFKSPMIFNPNRYLNESGQLNQLNHLSFGSGSRKCLGDQLANYELYILLAKFILKFKPVNASALVPLQEENSLILNKYPFSLAIEPDDFTIELINRNSS
ncbi:hypothetical protein DAMA08_053160 [Martiniozyma asiatica (nom. inval.)]|nr:hypothetical protein DAMA08_053160 [Martiniozyma asiatica]